MPHYTSLRAHCSFLKWCCICLIIEISYQEWAFISWVICKSTEPLFPEPFVCVLILFVFPDIHKGEPTCAPGSRKNCAKFFNYKNIFSFCCFLAVLLKRITVLKHTDHKAKRPNYAEARVLGGWPWKAYFKQDFQPNFLCFSLFKTNLSFNWKNASTFIDYGRACGNKSLYFLFFIHAHLQKDVVLVQFILINVIMCANIP